HLAVCFILHPLALLLTLWPPRRSFLEERGNSLFCCRLLEILHHDFLGQTISFGSIQCDLAVESMFTQGKDEGAGARDLSCELAGRVGQLCRGNDMIDESVALGLRCRDRRAGEEHLQRFLGHHSAGDGNAWSGAKETDLYTRGSERRLVGRHDEIAGRHKLTS